MAESLIPETLLYSAEDEWARVEEQRVTVGITDFAQQQLGDIVFVELPAVGDVFAKGDTFGVIESVKAVSDLFAPVAGEILEVNTSLADAPDTVNEDCYGPGWLAVLQASDSAEIEALMDAGAYAKYVAERDD